MNHDTIHALAVIAAVSSLCGGTYLLAGTGAALCLFGGLLMTGVVYARTVAINLRTKAEITDARESD